MSYLIKSLNHLKNKDISDNPHTFPTKFPFNISTTTNKVYR